MKSNTQNLASVFQPIWLSTGELVVSEDSNGWWNLMLLSSDFRLDKTKSWEKLWPINAEVGLPQWVSGLSTISESGDNIVALICTNGTWSIGLFLKQKTLQDHYYIYYTH